MKTLRKRKGVIVTDQEFAQCIERITQGDKDGLRQIYEEYIGYIYAVVFDVLKNKDFEADYFTKIDIRKTTVIPLNSKSAKLLTSHPAGSFSLLKDSKGEYTLRITSPSDFWNVSKYLVIKVK